MMDLFNVDDFSFILELRKIHKARIGHFSFSGCLLGLEISSRHRLSTFMFFTLPSPFIKHQIIHKKGFSQKSVNTKHSPCPKLKAWEQETRI